VTTFGLLFVLVVATCYIVYDPVMAHAWLYRHKDDGGVVCIEYKILSKLDLKKKKDFAKSFKLNHDCYKEHYKNIGRYKNAFSLLLLPAL
jgi:hypothetical protein